MRIFGRERQMLRIKDAKASKVVVALLHEDIVEVNLSLITEDGERLDLQIPDQLLPYIIQDLTITYEAIHPPLKTVGGRAAGWQGMRNGQ